MYSDEKQKSQVEESTQTTVKVDGTNVQAAAKHFEKNMYKTLRDRLNELKNKSGRPNPIPKEEKGRTR